jgi:hypothetical protein
MITCRKCKEINDAEASQCQKCGKNLLPGITFLDRIGIFIGGIIGFGFCGWMLQWLNQNPELTQGAEVTICVSPVFWVIGLVIFPILTLVEVLKKTPDYERYALRAERHKKIDLQQSVADLSEAIKLAPQKKQGALLRKRSDIHKLLGNEEESLKDRLGYLGSEVDDEGGFQSLGGAFNLPTDSITAGWREGELRGLVKLEQIKAVGYCKKCRKAVDLTWKLRCPEHHRKKPLAVKYVMPNDLDAGLVDVEQAGSKLFRKKRITKIIILVLILAAISACIYFAYLS